MTRVRSLFLALLFIQSAPAGAAQLTLTWTGTDLATQYLVEREESLGSFNEVGGTSAGVVSYVDSSVLGAVTYCYRVRAATGLGYTDYSNIACGAAAAGAGSIVDGFDRPDSSVLGNGWTTVSGTLTIQSGQVRNGAARMMHAAVQAGLVGSAQNTSASFAAVDLSQALRFGLLVRYTDPKNYYICYRQTGGTSVLRISRVIAGVETVLKSLAITNPLKEQFFALGCQVQGTTLVLSLNGASKLTASDLALSIGSVGMSLGSPTTGTGSIISNRADTFAATVQ
jgi:hypothetical protein